MSLQDLYKKEILPKLKEKSQKKNNLAAARLEKIVVNVGFGKHNKDKSYIDNIKKNLSIITGQKCIITKAKKSISAFKIREGMIIGAKVTLRGRRMYDFMEKLIHITFPRMRDFRGIDEKVLDKNGNLTIGFKEHLAFGEIKSDDVDNIHGLEVCLSIKTKNREEALDLLKFMKFPFKIIN